jgi:heme oxygenase
LVPEALPRTISHTISEGTPTRALLDRLRNETREEHQHIEERLDLLRPDLSLSAYAHILSRFYGFYRPWESHVADFASCILPDYLVRRQKVHNLTADLNYLGIGVPSLPLCSAVPSYKNVSAVLGGLYVTEGATLGGQIISRHLRRTFDFPECRGDTFFRSYGESVGPMWSSFRDILAGHSSPSTDDEIIRAAKRTFEALSQWFEGTT